MTYYEIITYLRSLVDKPRSESLLDKLNTAETFLKGDRYYRFIDQVGDLIEKRLNRAFYNIKEKILIDDTLDDNKFVVEFNEFKEEIAFTNKIAKITIIEDNNKNLLNKSIKTSTKKMIDELKEYLSNETTILSIIEEYTEKEKL